MTRVIRWLNTQQLPLHTPILDIGTGNGMLLVELVSVSLLIQIAKQGYTNLTGIDYCSSAIDLSRSICEKEELSESVHLEVTDFLTTFSASERFDVCLDKGTFDAVSLDPDGAAEMRRQYVQALCRKVSTRFQGHNNVRM
uniref:EEF1A lysine methyltransferase 2 n=1 Tax=Leptobrachium leishanense TaxID=445787 RepID=A0A8C5QXF1_9ANUR